jgi:DUF1365 family protein
MSDIAGSICHRGSCLEMAGEAAVLQSALYTGTVSHCRTARARNEFTHRLFFLYLDLAELDHIFADRWLWSVEGFNWASFRRADHLRRPGPLDEAVRDVVQEQLGFRPRGPVRILTHLRYLGYCFNPISIYYCYGADGRRLEAILAEVHNTPWGEEYLLALDTRSSLREGEWHVFELDKEFHVSPFMPMDIHYRWRFTAPGERLAVTMDNEQQGKILFSAQLQLQRRPLTGANLALALLQWPCMTGRVIAAIYWQALRLKAKGVPYCPHPKEPTVTKGSFHS